MTIQLTQEDLAIINVIASIKTVYSLGAKLKDAAIASEISSTQMVIDGMIAEYAYCKWHNIFFDVSPKNGISHFDCKTKKGNRIDIKSTRNPKGNLLVKLKDNPNVDIFIFAIVREEDVEFIGWEQKSVICTAENIKNLGYGDTYFFERNKLKRF